MHASLYYLFYSKSGHNLQNEHHAAMLCRNVMYNDMNFIAWENVFKNVIMGFMQREESFYLQS